MRNIGNDDFSVTSRERIRVETRIDKPPCIVRFQNPPNGGTWDNSTGNPPCDNREFTAPKNKDAIFSFDVECDTQIADGDPDPVAHYTLTFTSLTNPGDPPVKKHINVPKGAGPVPRFFTFTVA